MSGVLSTDGPTTGVQTDKWSVAQLQSLLHLRSDWVWEADADGRFVRFSHLSAMPPTIRAEWYVGKLRAECLAEAVPPQALEEHLSRLARREAFVDFTYWTRPEFGGICIQASGQPVYADGGAFAGYIGLARDVTEMMRSRELVAEAEGRLADVVQTLPDPVAVLDAFDRLLLFNAALQDLVGPFVRQGRTLAALVSGLEMVLVDPQPVRAWLASRRDGALKPASVPISGRNGRSFDLREWPLRGSGSLLEIRETTQTQQHAEHLHQWRERYDLAMVGSREGLFDYDAERHKIVVMPRYWTMLGYSPDDADWERLCSDPDCWETHLHPDDRNFVRTEAARWLADPAQNLLEMTYRMLRKDGEAAWIQARAMIVRDGDGRAIRMVGTHTDVSDRVRMERELRDAKVQAEAANRAKSRFLANISHELRTPLNAIIGFAELLRDEVFGPLGEEAYREYARDIHDGGQHLLTLINQILDLSKIEAGKFELRLERQDLAHILGNAVRLMRERTIQIGLTVTLDVPQDLPALVADGRALTQMINNLLSNAMKFTPAKGNIILSAGVLAGETWVRVADTGVGIAPEDIPRALASFGQVGLPVNDMQPGTGLGLPLVRALVEQHGGRFEIDSAIGRGTAVSLWFPPARDVLA
jgi:PAS domain S-box-containing protein